MEVVMQKRIPTLLAISCLAMLLIFIWGCPNPEEEETVPKVTNVTITADSEGDGVIISWDEVSDVDGYDLYTPDGDTILLDYDETAYNDNAPSQTGTYTIYTVSGSNYSDPVTIDDEPTAGTSVLLYMYNPSTSDPSGFGWNPVTGNGSTYQATAGNAAVIDFYVDTDFSFTAPANGGGSYTGDKTTYIIWIGTSNFVTAPLGPSGYSNYEAIQVGYFAFLTEENHYAKVHVTNENGSTVTFDYEFQPIDYLRLF
jgi:hypothetical protein